MEETYKGERSMSEKWKKLIKVKDSTPGKMYGNVKTINPTRAITSG